MEVTRHARCWHQCESATYLRSHCGRVCLLTEQKETRDAEIRRLLKSPIFDWLKEIDFDE